MIKVNHIMITGICTHNNSILPILHFHCELVNLHVHAASVMEYNFVHNLPEEYTCQVCMKLLDEPQATDCCGQHFCRACLNHWFQQKGKKQCPHCRSETFAHILYLPLKRKINELKVYCSNQERGCTQTMKLEELEKHLSTDNPNGCGYVNVKCPNKGCVVTCLRKDLVNHSNNTCLQRKVKCKYCGQIGQYEYITRLSDNLGHVDNCLEYPVDCPRRCDTIRDLKRKDLEAHKEVCPLEPVECPFSEAGCKQLLVRKDLDGHIQSSTQQHLLNLMATNTDLMTSHKTLMRECKEFQILKSTGAGVASKLETLQSTVKDRSVATTLEQITTTLNQVSLRLEKEGDQVVFQFSTNHNWISPVFKVNDIKMFIAMNSADSIEDNCTLSLIVLNGELDGKHQINIEWDLVLNQDLQKQFSNFPLLKAILNNAMVTYLCANCIKLPKQRSSNDSKPGQVIALKNVMSASAMSLYNFPTCVLTLTLNKHNC